MKPYKLKNGNLVVPKRAESNGTLGDAMYEIARDTPEWQKWIDYFKRTNQEPEEEGADARE